MYEVPESIVVDILNSGGSVVDGTTAKLNSNDKDQASPAIYEYSLWANPGDKLTFVPRDSRYVYLAIFLDKRVIKCLDGYLVVGRLKRSTFYFVFLF